MNATIRDHQKIFRELCAKHKRLEAPHYSYETDLAIVAELTQLFKMKFTEPAVRQMRSELGITDFRARSNFTTWLLQNESLFKTICNTVSPLRFGERHYSRQTDEQVAEILRNKYLVNVTWSSVGNVRRSRGYMNKTLQSNSCLGTVYLGHGKIKNQFRSFIREICALKVGDKEKLALISTL